MALLGCTVESDEASPSPTPTPIYVTIYVTVTPSPTPIPTATPNPTYKPNPTPFYVVVTATPTITPTQTITPTSTATMVPVSTTTPLPTATPYPTYTPTATPTAIHTPTETSTATPMPTFLPLRDPDPSTIWGEFELFSLLYSLKDRENETRQKYYDKHVAIRLPVFCCIFGGPNNNVYLGTAYAHGQPVKRQLMVTCSIDDVEDRHLPILAELGKLQTTFTFDDSPPPYVQVAGRINVFFLNYGGMEIKVLLSDCDVTAIGDRIVG